MLRRAVGLWSVVALASALLAGCDSHKDKAVDNTRTLLEHEIRIWSQPKYAGDMVRQYLCARWELALEFLAKEPPLEGPYMMAVILWLSAQDPATSGMTFDWCEYETHAVGIVLAATEAGRRRTWTLPVFAWEKNLWQTTAGTAWRDTVGRSRRAWLLPSSGTDPAIREVPRRDGRPPVQVLMPRHLLKVDLEVAIYDEKGNVSNFVPVFVRPEEPQVTE